MNLALLKRLAEAAARLVDPERIVVLGSAALLLPFPDLGADGEFLETSLDADLLITPCDETDAAMVEEALGEGRAFFRKFGGHVDLMRPSVTSQFPRGWEGRLVPFPGLEKVFALEVVDVCVAKLRVGREKDLAVLRQLAGTGRLDLGVLRERLAATSMWAAEMVAVHRRLDALESPSA